MISFCDGRAWELEFVSRAFTARSMYMSVES